MHLPHAANARAKLRKALKDLGIYHRLEWSPPHRLFVRYNNPKYEAHQRAERAFYSALVRRGDTVLDVGANKGDKTEIFASLGARVVAVEPDPLCARTLRRRFMLNRRVAVVEAAAGASTGMSALLRDGEGSPLNTCSTKWQSVRHQSELERLPIEVTTLDALMTRYGEPSFIKIDVEGYEYEVLRGLSRPVAAFSFEANLPHFIDESIACVRRLEELGRYRYQLASNLAEGWLLDGWVEADQCADKLRERGRYCEVFAQLTGAARPSKGS